MQLLAIRLDWQKTPAKSLVMWLTAFLAMIAGCADEGSASFAVDALRTSAHPALLPYFSRSSKLAISGSFSAAATPPCPLALAVSPTVAGSARMPHNEAVFQ
jgi:hypothetical protein